MSLGEPLLLCHDSQQQTGRCVGAEGPDESAVISRKMEAKIMVRDKTGWHHTAMRFQKATVWNLAKCERM